jgi:hypothetical protein
MQAHRYLTIVLALVVATLGMIASANWLMDPYALRAVDSATPAFEGLNEAQGAFLRNTLTAAWVKPRTVILGTSRAGAGLDEKHPKFARDDAPVLNLALGGASIQQTRLMLTHAQEQRQLRKAVIGLDLEAFLGGGRPNFDVAALRGNRESEPAWFVYARSLWSHDMLLASTERAVAALAPAPQDIAIPAAVSRDRFDEQLRNLQGQRGLVWITEFNNFYARLPRLFPVWRAGETWYTDAHRASAMREFRALLAYARSQGIELHLFISPVHARYLEWYRRIGWWPLFEHWKRALAESITNEAQDAGATAPFPLWDFSGFHPLATESVPRIRDLQARMRWYFETSHYSRATGDVILNRILDPEDAAASPLPNVRIDASNVERHIHAMQSEADRYRIDYPAEVGNVAEMVRYLRRVARK